MRLLSINEPMKFFYLFTYDIYLFYLFITNIYFLYLFIIFNYNIYSLYSSIYLFIYLFIIFIVFIYLFTIFILHIYKVYLSLFQLTIRRPPPNPLDMVRFTWNDLQIYMKPTVLKRMKNPFSVLFLSYGQLCLKFTTCQYNFIKCVTWKKFLVPKDAKCYETDFLAHEFFLCDFSLWDLVDFVFNIRSDLGTRDFCEPDSETLTSDTR